MFLFNQIGLTSSGAEQATMIRNALASTNTSASIVSIKVLPKPKAEVKKIIAPKPKPIAYVNVKQAVTNFFADTPVLANIARCESTYQQFDNVGNVLRGRVNKKDVGVMQINERYHASRAQKMGIDLHTLNGNMSYAKILYKEQGTMPWLPSKACWGGVLASAI